MHADFSRWLGGFPGQYSSVLNQQGRLVLDAELNEQNAILLDYLRSLTTDLIGPFAGPAHYAGFKVDPVFDDDSSNKKCSAVQLSPGHYYVYGLRCQAPGPHQSADEKLPIGRHDLPFVVYLVVWEQSVSAIQAPELIDPALSADVPDTTRRSQVRWRPFAGRKLPIKGEEKTLTDLGPDSIIRVFEEYNADPHRRPTLGARAHSGGEPEPGPATTPTPWGYRGVENQLYRVEIHRGGDADEATFKWSRDNGSVEFGLEDLEPGQDGRTATLQQMWYDARQGLEVGDWVELVDDRWAPLGTPTALMRVEAPITPTRQVTLADTDSSRAFDAKLHPLLRRWDQRSDDQAANQGIPVKRAHQRWFELEDGVQIRFEAESARYERGDFWLIPARTATSGVLWPQSHDTQPCPLAIPPQGPLRYLAPLALVASLDDVVDLRVSFGYRAHEHEASPEPSHPPVQRADLHRADLETGTTTVIMQAVVRYLLRSVSTLEQGAVYQVEDDLIIGRSPDVGIHIDHPDVSRHHAVFRFIEGALTVMDLGSTNGTEVNGVALRERVPMRLMPGDLIQFGPPELQFRVETG